MVSTSTKAFEIHENLLLDPCSGTMVKGFWEDGGRTRTNGEISRPISMFCRQAITRCNALFITSATDEQYLHNFTW